MICPIKRDFKQSEDFCRKDKTSGEWIVKYFQKHPRRPDHGTEKRDCTPLHCGKSGIEKQAKRRGTGAYRFCGKISSRKGLFWGRFFCVLFLPKRHTGFGAVSFASAYGLIDGNPGTNPLVIRLWRENFIPENSEKRIPQTGWREREFIRAI